MSTHSPQVLTFNVTFPSYVDNVTLSYGFDGMFAALGYRFQCASVGGLPDMAAMNASTFKPFTASMNCTVGPGVGKGLTFYLTACLGDTCFDSFSHVAANEFRYPKLRVQPFSLNPADGVVDVVHRLTFTGDGFINDPNLMSVWFGSPTGNNRGYKCTLQDSTNQYSVACLVGPGTENKLTLFIFTLDDTASANEPFVGGEKVSGDEFEFKRPALNQPKIVNVRGCSGVTEATGCPTEGGQRITINGEHFLDHISISVDGKDCYLGPEGVVSNTTLTVPRTLTTHAGTRAHARTHAHTHIHTYSACSRSASDSSAPSWSRRRVTSPNPPTSCLTRSPR